MADNKKINDFDDSLFQDNDDVKKEKKPDRKIYDFDDDFEDELLLSIKPKVNKDLLKMFNDEDDDNEQVFIEQRNQEIRTEVEKQQKQVVETINTPHSHEEVIGHQELPKSNVSTKPAPAKTEHHEQYIEINNPFAPAKTISTPAYTMPASPDANTTEETDVEKIKSIIESALYVVGQTGVSIGDLRRMTNASSALIKKILKDWSNELEKDSSRGILIKQFGDYYKFYSKPSNKEDLNKLITIKYKNPLSSKVMEVLAIIAYNQPCTKAIIEEIRLKDPTGTIQKLIDLGLVIDAGRASTPGCPILYTVTPKFYDIFGIKSLADLPKITIDQPYFDENTSFFDTTRFEE